MGATHEEIMGLADHIENKKVESLAQRNYICGDLFGSPVVTVLSRWGKVAAASTATTLIQKFNIDFLIMTGLAGALDSSLKIGDVIIAKSLYQHDLDPRPLFNQFEIPFLNQIHIGTDRDLSGHAIRATQNFLKHHKSENSSYLGTIVSGDQFIVNNEQKQGIREKCPDALAIEMEGAAVAQVCYEHSLPFAIIRTISDAADESSEFDFSDFLQNKAPTYTLEIIRELLMSLIQEDKEETRKAKVA